MHLLKSPQSPFSNGASRNVALGPRNSVISGPASRHLVSKDDLRRFLEILPNRDGLLQGLNAIVLDRGDRDCMGWHRPGVIGLCAWDRCIVFENCVFEFIVDHREILDKLNVPYNCIEGGTILFTEATARAFALIHVLVHELGHHHDRMTTRSRKVACRGEGYAEAYARKYEDEILACFQKIFEL